MISYTEYPQLVTTIKTGGKLTPPSSKVTSTPVLLSTEFKLKSTTIETRKTRVNGKEWRRPTDWGGSSITTHRTPGYLTKVVKGSQLIGNTITIDERVYAGTAFIEGSLRLGDIWDGGIRLTDPNLRARLETETMAKFDDGKFHMASATVELSGTLGMLAHRTSPIWRSILAARRREWGKIPHLMGFSKEAARDFRKDAVKLVKSPRRWSDLYLEYKFGWDPLFSDIAGLYEYASMHIQKSEYYLEAVKTFETRASSSSGTYSASANRRNTYKLFATVTSDALRKASEVGLLDPLGIAWEGYPMSFVVDWLFPVGNLLTAARARNGLKFKAGYLNRRDTLVFEESIGLPIGYQGNPQRVKRTHNYFVRDTVAGFPFPKPYLKSPFSTNTVVTGAALASQVYLNHEIIQEAKVQTSGTRPHRKVKR